MYKLFLCLRYLLHRRIAIVPILAVMLCVAMDLIVTSLMGGFLDKVRSSVRGLFGDVIISNRSLSGFGYYDTYVGADGRPRPGLLQYLRAISGDRQPLTQPESQPGLARLHRQPAVVKQATPIVETYAVLRLPSDVREGFTNPVRVLGIVPDQYSAVTEFQDGLFWQRPFGPQVSPGERARQTSSEQPPRTSWHGPPDFSMAPLPGGGKVPLAEVVNAVGERRPIAEPVGVIVGVRVFWSSPDKDGRYPRQILPPGHERVQLTFLPISPKGAAADKPEMKEFFLVDTAYTHIPQIDQSIAYVPFDRLQNYLTMKASEAPVPILDETGQEAGQFLAPARTTRVLVKLAGGVSLKAGRDAVQRAVDAWIADRDAAFESAPVGFQTRSIYFEPFRGRQGLDGRIVDRRPNIDVLIWEEANKEYFSAIANQRFIALLMVGVVSLTVVALIWVIFIMIVVEKTKDIGIIKSVGGSAGGIAWIFLVWSAIIGAIGSALGGLLGWLFIDRINGIEQWLSAVISKVTGTETRLFDPRAYLFDSIPARFVWSEIMWIAASAVLAAMLGALLPAWRAGRMDPVRSLRYE